MGKAERSRRACAESPVGKLLPEDLYVHKSVEDSLPPLVRLILFAARQIVGDVDYDLEKVSTDGRKVSFLRYPSFEKRLIPRSNTACGCTCQPFRSRCVIPPALITPRSFIDSHPPPILSLRPPVPPRSCRTRASI